MAAPLIAAGIAAAKFLPKIYKGVKALRNGKNVGNAKDIARQTTSGADVLGKPPVKNTVARVSTAAGIATTGANIASQNNKKSSTKSEATETKKITGPSAQEVADKKKSDQRAKQERRSATRANDSKPLSNIERPAYEKKAASKEAPKSVAASGGKSSGVSPRGQAFRAARSSGKSEFTFEGKKYHTRQAGETPSEHKAFLAKKK
jgi:hypothetical protein